MNNYLPENWENTCDGQTCKCAACGQCECACDADWTPAEVYELRDILTGLVEAMENYGEGRSLMHPRVSIALSKAQQHININQNQ